MECVCMRIKRKKYLVLDYSFVLDLKKLHDLLFLKITQLDEEKQRFPLAQIVGRGGIKWELEVPVDKGWIDIYVPRQERIEQPYVIEVETGYNFDCSEILRKHERFRKTMTISVPLFGPPYAGRGSIERAPFEKIHPKLCVVIPKDFAEFVPLFRAKEISVFLWEGKLEWKCKRCEKITLGSTPWKPTKCSSCNKNERSLRLVGLRNFKIREAYRVP